MIKKWNILFLMVLSIFSTIALSRTLVISGNSRFSVGSSLIRGNGKIEIDKRKLGLFEKLSTNVTADIEYVTSDSYQIEITTDDNIVPLIVTTVKDRTLFIDSSKSFSTVNSLRIKVYGPATLYGVSLNGASKVSLHGIAGNTLKININGSGNVTALGKVKNLIININGSSEIDTKKLSANDVTINGKGSSSIIVSVTKKLDVVVDGVSSVTYVGSPEVINKTIHGFGSITSGK